MRFVALLIISLLLLAGCQESTPPRGSAQDQAASAQARAESNTRAADAAGVDAAKAKARADELANQARADPTATKIQAAADARVESAAAQAVADALAKQATRAQEDARAAGESARKEREAEAVATDLRQWVKLCRWIGLLGVAGGAVLGGLLCYFVGIKVGAPAGGLIAGTGLLVVAFGSTVTWLPLMLGAAVLAGLALWAIAYQRSLSVSKALSQTVDALEGNAAVSIADAKQALGKALKRSGLVGRLAKARASWKRVLPITDSPR